MKNLTSALITLGQSTTIQSFFSDGAFDLTGGTFSGSLASSASTLQVNSTLTVNGGGIANFTINKGTGGSVVFSPSGGNFLSNDIVNADLDLSAPNSYVRLVNANTFNGAISLGASGGDGIHLQDGNSTMILGKTGSLSGFGGVVQDGGGATITNNGTINANSAANALAFGVTTFNNVGTAEATNGATLNLNNTNTNAAVGSTIAAKGANSVVAIAGTFTGTGNNLLTATDGGQIQVNGASLLGTINTDANTALVLSSSGSNLLNGTTVNGNLNLSANTAYLKLVGADTVNGTISLGASGGDGLHLQDGNSVFVLNGTLVGLGGVVQDGGGATFTNNGTVNANSVGNALTLGVTTFNNVGTAEATNGGTLALNNTTTNNTGLLAATGGGVLDISGTLNSNAGNSINGVGGTVNIQGASLLGTINETAGTSLVLNSSGYNLLSGTTVNGNLDLSSSTAYLRLDNIDTVNGNISLGASGGDGLHLRDGNSVFTLNGSLTGFGGVAQDGGGAKFTNNGTVNANTNGAYLTLAVSNFNNVGTAEATNSATLALNNTDTNASAGSTIAAKGAGSVVAIAGTFNGVGNNLLTATDGGQIQVNGASLLGTINTDANTALVFNNNGLNLLNNTTVNGNLDLSSPGATAYLKIVNTDTVNGNISLNASGGDGIHLQDGNSTLVLGKSGSLTGSGDVVQDGGGATILNKGTINANSVGLALNINTSTFTNTGTTEVQNGSELSVGGATADSGDVLVKTGGTATFSQGITQTGGLTAVDGTLNSPLTLTGGTLTGNGTVNGAVVNNGGTVKAGDPFGTLAVNGPFTQTTNGTLDAQFTQAQASLLAVTGVVTTGGALSVNYLGSVPYTLGSGPFTFLDYGTLGTESTNTLGLTQYFTNETALTNDTGLITGSNGFTYELLNNTGANSLQLQVLTAGTPAVPEASTTVSLGLLLSLGGAGLWSVKRCHTAAAR